MLRIRWSSHTRTDFLRVTAFWLEREESLLPAVISAIRKRVAWIADGHHLVGTPVGSEGKGYRWYLEREYGYKIYYRVEGNPPDTIGVVAIRHGRQRPLRASSLRRYAK